MENVKKSVFATLNNVNVQEHVEKKNGLSYLPWAWAWAEVKKLYPDATFTIYENADGLFYHTDGRTCWVKTGVTIEGVEMIEYLPVMDFRNLSISAERVTSVDVNKTIQRSLTKAAARHGLGLYIYAGEDLPEVESNAGGENVAQTKEKAAESPFQKAAKQALAEADEVTRKLEQKRKVYEYLKANPSEFLRFQRMDKYNYAADVDMLTGAHLIEIAETLNKEFLAKKKAS